MKATILTLIISMTSLNIMAQSDDERQWESFVEYLSANGAKISVSHMNDMRRKGTRYNIAFESKDILQNGETLNDNNRVPKLVDSIKTFLDGKARNCIESYRYENHSDLTDTITYSLALKGYGKNNGYLLDLDKAYNENFQWSGDHRMLEQTHQTSYPSRHQQQEMKILLSLKESNRKMWLRTRKTCLFDYVGGHGNLLILSTEENTAKSPYHNFHIESFDSLLSKETKTVKAYPVKYKFDNPKDSVSNASLQSSYITRKIMSDTDNTTYYHSFLFNRDDIGTSESTGTLYIISKEDAKEAYHTLFKKAKSYVNSHPEECCEIEYSNRHFSFSGLRSTTKYRVNHIALSDYVLAEMSKDGTLYILRLNVTGDYWIPKNWKQIKSAINGKVTLIKK